MHIVRDALPESECGEDLVTSRGTQRNHSLTVVAQKPSHARQQAGATIIGCGNVERGDDAAGILVIRRLREMGIEALEHSGEALDLLEQWTGRDHVVVVDAVVTGQPAGTIFWWSGEEELIPDGHRRSSHAYGLAEAVGLARALGRMPKRLSICGIEGTGFELGRGPCPQVLQAVEELARRLAREGGLSDVPGCAR